MATAAPQGHDQSQGQGEVLEDYWREFHEIEQNKDVDVDEEELSKTPDGQLLLCVCVCVCVM